MALTVDEVYTKIGGFRQFQWFLVGMIGYFILTTGTLNNIIVSFIAAEPDWKCVNGYMNNTICRFNKSITLTSKNYKARCKMPREAWTFAEDFTSIVTEYDLVCDKSILLSIAQSSSWIGMFIGLLIGGYLSDKYGRRIVLCFGFPINVIASIISAVFPKSLIVFIVCRIFIGLGSGLQNSSSSTLLMEFTTEKYRPLLGVGCFVFWSVGLMMLPMIGYFARGWKTFLLITSLCSAPCILLCWLIPESPRWLLLHNKEKEARAQLLKVAKINKRTLPDDKLKKPVVLGKRASFRQLFSSWKVTKTTLISWNLWFTLALVYYGVSYGSVDLGGNRYLNFFLISLVGFPNMFVLMWSLKRFGRKASVICPLFITVVASAISVAIPADQTAASVGGRVTAAIIANFCIGLSFNGIYIWSNELYPTVIRATGMSMCSATARIGSFAASYIIWLIRIHAALPYGLFGVISIQAAIFGLFLPETRGAETLETMEDMKKPKNQTDQEFALRVHPNDETTKNED